MSIRSQTIAGRSTGLAVIAITLAALFLTAFAGCSSGGDDKSHLRVVALPYTGFATFYIAQEEGYFAEQGLDVEFVRFSASSEAIPLLAQGSLDVVAGSNSASLMNAMDNNPKIRIIAAREYYSPDCEGGSLMVRQDLYESGEIDTVAELAGRKVVVTCIACISDFALAKVLETAGLSFDDVSVAKLGAAETIAAFENRGVDAAFVGSPHIAQLQTLGYATTLASFEQLMPGFQLGYIMFGPSLIDENPELGEKFAVAYLKGARQYAEGKTERNLEIVQQYTGLDMETLLRDCWKPVRLDGHIDDDSILAFQDWAYESGYVENKKTLDELVDTRFIDYANEVLGPAS